MNSSIVGIDRHVNWDADVTLVLRILILFSISCCFLSFLALSLFFNFYLRQHPIILFDSPQFDVLNGIICQFLFTSCQVLDRWKIPTTTTTTTNFTSQANLQELSHSWPTRGSLTSRFPTCSNEKLSRSFFEHGQLWKQHEDECESINLPGNLAHLLITFKHFNVLFRHSVMAIHRQSLIKLMNLLAVVSRQSEQHQIK